MSWNRQAPAQVLRLDSSRRDGRLGCRSRRGGLRPLRFRSRSRRWSRRWRFYRQQRPARTDNHCVLTNPDVHAGTETKRHEQREQEEQSRRITMRIPSVASTSRFTIGSSSAPASSRPHPRSDFASQHIKKVRTDRARASVQSPTSRSCRSHPVSAPRSARRSGFRTSSTRAGTNPARAQHRFHVVRPSKSIGRVGEAQPVGPLLDAPQTVQRLEDQRGGPASAHRQKQTPARSQRARQSRKTPASRSATQCSAGVGEHDDRNERPRSSVWASTARKDRFDRSGAFLTARAIISADCVDPENAALWHACRDLRA